MEEMKIVLENTCPFCGKTYPITVSLLGYLAYEDGALAQTAFKDESAETRESIISGICPSCQQKIFG
jgi:hypothetical protein